MDTNGMAPNEAANPVESPLLNDPAPSGERSLEQELGLPESGAEQAGRSSEGQAFKFAGREYPNQSAAEKAVKQLYGKFSDSQGIVNTIKKALNDPELLEALQDDPKWSEILGKLGIERGQEEVREAESRENQQNMTQEQMYHEWKVDTEAHRLEMEEFRFERQLGHPLTPEERRNTLSMIKQAHTLSYDQAYFLGNRDKVMAQARQPAAPAGGARPASGRPAPPPVRGAQGAPVSGKKGVHQMSDGEWKENVRGSDEIREILSRKGR